MPSVYSGVAAPRATRRSPDWRIASSLLTEARPSFTPSGLITPRSRRFLRRGRVGAAAGAAAGAADDGAAAGVVVPAAAGVAGAAAAVAPVALRDMLFLMACSTRSKAGSPMYWENGTTTAFGFFFRAWSTRPSWVRTIWAESGIPATGVWRTSTP